MNILFKFLTLIQIQTVPQTRHRLSYSHAIEPLYPTPANRPGAPEIGEEFYAVLDRDNQGASNMRKIGRHYMAHRGARFPWNVAAGAAAAVEGLRPTEEAWMQFPVF